MANAKSRITKKHNRGKAARRRASVKKSSYKRRYPIGAELIGKNETHFRVWAPKAKRVEVVIEEKKSRGAQAPPTFQLAKKRADIFRGRRRPAREVFIGFAWMEVRKVMQIRRRDFNRRDRMGLRW